MAKRNRGRTKGRFEEGEYFAAIPNEVLESEAYRALPDYAARVLIAIAGNYSGINNGNLSLTREQGRKRGVKSAWHVPAGLDLLMRTGLLKRTREGKNRDGHYLCSLYALAWKDINPTPKAFPEIVVKRPAPRGYAVWTRPDDWEATVKNIRRSMSGEKRTWPADDFSSGPDVRTGTRPDVRNGNGTRRQVREPTPTQTRRHGHPLEVPSHHHDQGNAEG